VAITSDHVIYVDYDGTITDRDTFYALARDQAQVDQWRQLEEGLQAGTMQLRELLNAQARAMRISLDEADALLAQRVNFDSTFGAFVGACEQRGVALTIISSGVAPLIDRALGRQGLGRVKILASEVVIEPTGWVFRHRDDSANGHDKAAAVRAAQARGKRVVFIGDGLSDYAAAVAADRRFAKRGRALERFLGERGVQFTAFDTFAQIHQALFE
jgi:2-hydroxy-3-keto-5-methylthiopentenyl-1-phosphate phosphatase